MWGNRILENVLHQEKDWFAPVFTLLHLLNALTYLQSQKRIPQHTVIQGPQSRTCKKNKPQILLSALQSSKNTWHALLPACFGRRGFRDRRNVVQGVHLSKHIHSVHTHPFHLFDLFDLLCYSKDFIHCTSGKVATLAPFSSVDIVQRIIWIRIDHFPLALFVHQHLCKINPSAFFTNLIIAAFVGCQDQWRSWFLYHFLDFLDTPDCAHLPSRGQPWAESANLCGFDQDSGWNWCKFQCDSILHHLQEHLGKWWTCTEKWWKAFWVVTIDSPMQQKRTWWQAASF